MSAQSNSISSLNLGDVESSFNEINKAIIAHSRWLVDWSMKVICRTNLESQHDFVESHRECLFGRWYYAEHPNYLLGMSGFSSIEPLHRTVHLRLQTLMDKVNKGKPVNQADLTLFIDSEASFTETIIHIRDELYQLLLSFDFLTGALTRQAFLHILGQEHARVIRDDEVCSLVMLDIDGFKKINDNYGHAVGDQVLTAVADFIIGNIRPYDSICRYGGEEFIICMPNTTVEASLIITERIRKELRQNGISVSDGNSITVSASFGIAPLTRDTEVNESINNADQALYRAKNSGRNKVEVWT